jgi:hypothetical protein
MLFALLLAVAPQAYGPILPAGSNPDLHTAFNAVATQLSAGDFAKAKAQTRLLPSFSVTYQWDDSKVPAGQRAEFVAARNLAFKTLMSSVDGLTIKPGAKPAIKFTFENNLATDPDSGLPRGVALFFSDSVTEPRLEAVLGLRRGNPFEKSTAVSIHNEVMFAVGSYLGLAPSPLLGTMMGRTDLQMQQHSIVDVTEVGTIENVRAAMRRLDLSVQKKERIKPGNPRVSFEPTVVERGPVIQGTDIHFTVQVANIGDAPLAFKVIPDCGCVTAANSPVVQPGGVVAVPIKVDTKDITSELNRHLILISNDSTRPVQRFPIRIRTFPRYQIFTNQSNILIAEGAGADTELFFVSPADKPLEVTGVDVTGNPGKATFEPWQGDLADPASNGELKPQKGFRLKVHVEEPQVSGRSASTIVIRTNDPNFATVRHTIFTQKGIAVMPASVFFGDLEKGEKEATVLLTRPGKPFAILKMDSDSSYVTAWKLSEKNDTDYKIVCKYNGKAPSGDFRAVVTIHTNDPKQPRIRIPIMGNVK